MAYKIKKPIVAASLQYLRNQKTHEHFAGYLCLQQRAAALGRLSDLQPSFISFFDYFFKVEGQPSQSPYVKAFISQTPSSSNQWLNKNVAGSYAPSSIRATFKKVVSVSSATGKYSLKEDHAEMALRHLLNGSPLNVYALSIFLYRNFDFLNTTPSIEDSVAVFKAEFGYSIGETTGSTPEYTTLFNPAAPEFLKGDWFE